MNPISVIKNLYHSQSEALPKKSILEITKEQTFKSLTKGTGLTSLRNGIFLVLMGCDKSDVSNSSIVLNLIRGMLATLITYPIDVVKKEVQRNVSAEILPTAEKLWATGVSTFYRGYGLNLPRMGLATAALVFAQHSADHVDAMLKRPLDEAGHKALMDRIETSYLI
jgi:hypothetical protein